MMSFFELEKKGRSLKGEQLKLPEAKKGRWNNQTSKFSWASREDNKSGAGKTRA